MSTPIRRRATTPSPVPSSRSHSFLLMAGLFTVGMAGTTLPTPLYALYQQQLHFGALTVAAIFATYAFGVLAALVLTGPWSDQMGRRPILAGAVTMSAASSALFLYGGSLEVLLLARALSGLSAGLLTPAATIAVIELAPMHLKQRAALLAAAANMTGIGLGALLAGVVSQYFPWPLHLVFAVHLALLMSAALVLIFSPETVHRPSRLTLRIQRLSLPESARAAFGPAAIGCFAGFALLGLLTSLEPSILGKVYHLSNRATTGGLIFSVFFASLCGQVVLRRIAALAQLPLACGVLVVGAALMALSLAFGSLPLLILGALSGGFGQGGVFAASLATLTAASPDEQRAEVITLLFVVIYLAVSIPVLTLGAAIEMVGLQAAGTSFLLLVLLLSTAALGMLLRSGWHPRGESC